MEERELLRSVLESAPDFIARVDLDGRFLFVNRLVPGATMEDTIGRPVFDYIPREAHERVRSALEQVVRTGRPACYDAPAINADGTLSEYRTRVGPIRDGGRVVGLTLIATDVTRHNATERALRESEEKLRMAVDASGIGLWSFDVATHRAHWDEGACRVFGVPPEPEPPAGHDWLAVVHPADRAVAGARLEGAIAGSPLGDWEYRIVRPDGATRWVTCTGCVVRDERGVVTRLMGGVFDVTERRQLEEQLRQAQKMEAIGQLSAGIAHNFNNMLAVILPTIDIAASRAPEPVATMLEGAREAAQRAASIVRELMLLSGKPRAGERKQRAVEAVVERTVTMCRTTFDPQIAIEVELAPDLPLVVADDGQLEQALLNVLINARDALEDVHGRPRRIRVAVDAVGREALPPYLGAAGGGYVRVRVEDSGAGMDEETRRRAFEPFFTTKDVGRGTGLGLSTTYGIVKDHGGLVDCQSAPGRGTTITLALPARCDEVAGDAAAPDEARATPAFDA